MISRKFFAISACGLLALGVAACGDDDDGGGSSDLSGTIRIDGSSTVGPPDRGGRRAVQRREPRRRASPSAHPAPAAASRSSAPARPTSPTPPRQIEPEEEALCKKGGVEYEEVRSPTTR